MNRVFEVVDELEISREAIQVELLPSGAGSVERLTNGRIRVVLPEAIELRDWMPTLATSLRRLASEQEGEPT